jgi:two-component system NtrC family sensor kinase
MKTLFVLLPFAGSSQFNNIDSLRNALSNAADGEMKYRAASNIYFYFQEINRDSALYYAGLQEEIAKKYNNKIGEGVAAVQKSYQLMGLGKYAEALKELQLGFSIAEDKRNEKQEQWKYFFTPFSGNNRLLLLSYTHHMYALLMLNTENLEQQISHFNIARDIGTQINYAPRIMLANLNLGDSYLSAGLPDSALYYEKQAEDLAKHVEDSGSRILRTYYGTVQMHLGEIYYALNNESMSLASYYKGIYASRQNNNRATLYRIHHRLIKYFLDKGNKDSALHFSLENIKILSTLGNVLGRETNYGTAYENIYLAYKLNNRFDSAFKYQSLALIAKDSLTKLRIKNLAEFQKLTYSEQLRLQNLEKEKVVYQNKIRTWFMLAGIGVFLLLAIIFYINNRQKHKAKLKIEQAYHDLKATQQQLVQSEKMASLGELTAGIAHEIQNPLNFVNNFSEVNNELIEEVKSQKSKLKSEELDDLLNDIFQNNEKINHHGKRADAIVKGMLQHSRTGSGQKEPTDINALCDEYLRLAYHGLRAKDNSFNAKFESNFDNSIGKIKIIPQDMGRVILNLINNAFYAVDEKKKQMPPSPKGEKEAASLVYEPVVTVTTKRLGPPPTGGDRGKIEIRVADNGNGIPQKILDKIFQPFFTTKPTGQGTGLGLSLAYDIVTKGHNGELKVETKEIQGTEFIISLPIN